MANLRALATALCFIVLFTDANIEYYLHTNKKNSRLLSNILSIYS